MWVEAEPRKGKIVSGLLHLLRRSWAVLLGWFAYPSPPAHPAQGWWLRAAPQPSPARPAHCRPPAGLASCSGTRWSLPHSTWLCLCVPVQVRELAFNVRTSTWSNRALKLREWPHPARLPATSRAADCCTPTARRLAWRCIGCRAGRASRRRASPAPASTQASTYHRSSLLCATPAEKTTCNVKVEIQKTRKEGFTASRCAAPRCAVPCCAALRRACRAPPRLLPAALAGRRWPPPCPPHTACAPSPAWFSPPWSPVLPLTLPPASFSPPCPSPLPLPSSRLQLHV